MRQLKKPEPEDPEYDTKEESSEFYDVKLEVKEESFDDAGRSEQDDHKPLQISIAHEQFQNKALKTEMSSPLVSPIKVIRVEPRRIDDHNGEPSYKARRISSLEPQESDSRDIHSEFDFDRSVCDNTATASLEMFPSCGASTAMDTELSEDDAAVTSLLNMEHLERSSGFGQVSCSSPHDDAEGHRFAEESDELEYPSNFQLETDFSGSHYSYDEQDAMSSSRFECEEAVEPSSQCVYVEPENLDCSGVDPNNWNYGSSVVDFVQQESDNELNSIMADLNRFNEDLSGTLTSWDSRMSDNVANIVANDIQLEGDNDVSMGGYENNEASSLQNEMQSAINSILMLQQQPNVTMHPHSSREQNLFDDFDLRQSNDDLDAAVNSILF